MTEKRFDKDNPRFRDEFGSVNDLLTGESYLCGENGFIGERDALDTAIALCDLLNQLHDENKELKQVLIKCVKQLDIEIGKKHSTYAVTLFINSETFKKIKEICK